MLFDHYPRSIKTLKQSSVFHPSLEPCSDPYQDHGISSKQYGHLKQCSSNSGHLVTLCNAAICFKISHQNFAIKPVTVNC